MTTQVSHCLLHQLGAFVCLPECHSSKGCIWCCTTMLCCAMLCCAMLDLKASFPSSQCTALNCMLSAHNYNVCHFFELTNPTLVIHSTAVDSQATANTMYNVCSSMPKPLKMSYKRSSKYSAQWWAAPSCGRPTVPTLTLRKLNQPQEQEGP